MNLLWLAIAIVVAAIVTSFTDWFFSGFLFHVKYMEYPETWRGNAGEAQSSKILWSNVYGALSCAAFIWVALRLALVQPQHTLKLALAVWVIGVVPVIGTYLVWVKMHPLNAVAHMLSWLARFIVCALCVSFIYRGH
jgi:hypothetical protein